MLQIAAEAVKTAELLHCRGFIRLISSCEMRERTLDCQVWNTADSTDCVDTLFTVCKTDAGHAGVDCDMDRCFYSQCPGSSSKFFCHFHREHSRADSVFDHSRVIRFKGIAEHKDRLGDPGLTQRKTLFYSRYRKAPDILIRFDHLCDRHSTVAVAVRLDDGNHFYSVLQICFHVLKICSNRLFINICGDSSIFA